MTNADDQQTDVAATGWRAGVAQWLREWRGFLLFVALMLVFRSVIADWNHVPSGSMRPTLLVGDRVVVDKLAYDLRLPFTFKRLSHHKDPQRGDIITFESSKDDKLLIKRVIGIPGDVVAMRNNLLSVNGETASYRPLSATEIDSLQLPDADMFNIFEERVQNHQRITMRLQYGPRDYRSFNPIRVPPDSYLVLGDNRDRSGDFRVLGFVARDRVLGRAHAVAFSLDYDNYYIPRGHRFAQSLDVEGEEAVDQAVD
jgi:signal peptidase I